MGKILLIIVTILSIISCQTAIKEKESITFKNNYKFKSEIENEIKSDSIKPDHQLLATDFSFKSDHKNALKQWDLAISPNTTDYKKSQLDSVTNLYKVVDAKNYIINKSKENQIVIINESHHNASHRVFTKSLLKELFENGYSNLFLEALKNGDKADTLLNSRKYPIYSSGFYIKNPQFGNLIRTAKEIGYTIYPYETTGKEGGAQREIDQANNIYNIIKKKPNKKNLIHCGSGHAFEGNVDFFGGLALAGRLHELTGINPLTVDQVFYSEKSTIKNNNIFIKAFDLKQASVLTDKNHEPFAYHNNGRWIDVVVFHPITKYINNRPNWLFENRNQNVKITVSDLEMDFPIMVFVYKKGEDINSAIPIDIVEVMSKTNDCNLALKKGDYKIIATNGNKSVKFEQNVK